jgi:hypothetical protein
MGIQPQADVLHSASRLENRHDIFVTENTGFLSKWEWLSDLFAGRIMPPEELVALF